MAVSRILHVSGSANFSTRDVWDGYRIGLEMCGIPVIPYPAFSFLKVLSPEAVCNDIIGTALDVSNGIDCVVFVDGLYFRGKRGRVPSSIRKAGVPTVLIGTDDPYEQIGNADSFYTYRFTNEIRGATMPSPTCRRRRPRCRKCRGSIRRNGTSRSSARISPIVSPY